MHGYDLRKRLRSDFGLLASLSFGSLYPALGRLEADGAVHEVRAERANPAATAEGAGAFPLTGSITGERAAFRARLAARRVAPGRAVPGTRGRRVYEITERGEALFQSLLEEDDAKPEDERSFALRWAFARYLAPSARVRLLERRQSQLLERRRTARQAAAAPGRPLDRYERSLREHADEAIEHDLAWIAGLLEAERASAAVGDGEPAPPQAPAPSNGAEQAVAVLQSATGERSEP